LVRRVTVLPEPALIAVSVEALYGQALLLGYHPIRPADAALLNRSFLGLLDRAVPGGAP
jgi:molecular chaperone HtpG